jgi:hypothetical protein
MTQPRGPNRSGIVRFLTEYGAWGLLGAALGGFIGLGLGGPGAPHKAVSGVVPAPEWSDYLSHSWIEMILGALVGAVVFAGVAKFVKDKRRTR